MLKEIKRFSKWMREKHRAVVHKNAQARVLAMGDSHIRVFEHWSFLCRFPRTAFDIVYVPGATAWGIGNRHSQTNACNRFMQHISERCYDLVLVNLGEVDTAYVLWRKAERENKSVQDLTRQSAERYCAFLKEIANVQPLLVISAPLPTLADQQAPGDEVAKVRDAIKVPQSERTALTLYFNQRVSAFCTAAGIPFLDGDSAALGPDGLVRKEWVNHDFYDHHYARRPYARWLADALKNYVAPNGVRLH